MPGPGLSFFGEEEKKEILDVLECRELSRYRFDNLSAGQSKVYQFERLIEQTFRTPHCLGTNSCTSALLAGLAALKIGPGDEVIVPGYTFIATIAAVIYAGALPVLAEIDESLTLDVEDVAHRINSRTKAIIVVHMMGGGGDLKALKALADSHGIPLIEDVAQACGGSYNGAALGTIGTLGVYSLNVFKTITAGDGGFLCTSDRDAYERAFAFHDHGALPFREGVADGGQMLGLNLRMHEITGALALAQARKLGGIIASLREKHALFCRSLSELLPLRFRTQHDPEGDCCTTLTIVLDSEAQANDVAIAIGSKTLARSGKHYYANMSQLRNRKMPTLKGYPFYSGELQAAGNYEAGSLPRTDDILSRCITFSVGVSDSYLGTDFGINVHSSDEDIRRQAATFARLTQSILT